MARTTIDDVKFDIVFPTAINVVLMVNENIIDNLRQGQSTNLELPSLYRRALLVVGETTEIAVVRHKGT